MCEMERRMLESRADFRRSAQPLQDWLPDELTPRPSLLGYQAVPPSLPPTLCVPGPGTDPAGSDPLPSPGARRAKHAPGSVWTLGAHSR